MISQDMKNRFYTYVMGLPGLYHLRSKLVSAYASEYSAYNIVFTDLETAKTPNVNELGVVFYDKEYLATLNMKKDFKGPLCRCMMFQPPTVNGEAEMELEYDCIMSQVRECLDDEYLIKVHIAVDPATAPPIYFDVMETPNISEEELDKVISGFEKQNSIQNVKRKIDEAIDVGDKELFLTLTEELKNLQPPEELSV